MAQIYSEGSGDSNKDIKMRLLDLDSTLTASVVAAKNAFIALVAATPTAGAVIGVSELTAEFGPMGVAALAAIVGSLCRWYYFKLETQDGIRGLVISPVIGMILSDAKIPLFQTFLGELSPESVPIINGFFVGMFGLLIVGFFIDFLREYAKKKSGGK